MNIFFRKIKALEKIDKIVVKGSQKYYNSIDLRVLIKGLPHPVGGLLDNLLAYKGSKAIKERTDLLFEEIAESLRKLEESKIDKDFFNNEDAFYLFLKIYDSAIKCREKRKVRYFKNIFVNSIQKGKSDYYFKERFINIVNDLSELHIEILKLYIDNEKLFVVENRLPEGVLDIKKLSEKLNITESQAEAFCNDLLRYNLLYDYAIGTYDYKRGYFRLTSHATDFMNFVISEV